ncbi:MAG: EAL domain-containing protein, partial [Erysipelotrichaceae bacterium]
MEKKYILVVEDNEINRHMLYKILDHDYVVLEAENGEIALRMLRENYELISLVLLDIVMPVLDGFGVLKQMKNDLFLSKIPVIVVSDQSSREMEERALEEGANEYILKPYRPAIIKQRIAKTIYYRETSSFVDSIQKDPLTGLYSKEYFYVRVEEIIHRQADIKYDLLCCDIERFRLVNEIYGTAVGNELLRYVGKDISKRVGDKGICGRIGPDIFAFIIQHQDQYFEENFAEVINDVNKFGIKLDIILRYGIYQIDQLDTPASLMCDRAVLAQKSIKGKYNTYFAYYDDNIRQKLLEEQTIISYMKEALVENQFKVYFQPKFDLKTEKIIGAEALVRWIHPTKGFLTPKDFIPIFEKNGFIADLDYYIWDQCCKKMRAWKDMGNEIIPISINLSRISIYDPHLPDKLIDLIKKYGLSPKYLHLEITESAYTEGSTQLIEMISKIRRMGFIIEMDDFGTGYSSLNMLSELPIDIIKLDMRFIQKEEKKSRDRSILSFIISLAKWMNLKVVAEGIETLDQLQYLKSINCEFGQGYYYSKPLPQEQFEDFLRNTDLNFANQNVSLVINKEQLNIDNLKHIIFVGDYRQDCSKFELEYNNVYQIDKMEVLEAINFMKDNGRDVCALILCLPYEMDNVLIEELGSCCENEHIALILVYDNESNIVEDINNYKVCDYIKRPYDLKRAKLRVDNCISAVIMEKFDQEKEINDAIIEMRRRTELDILTGLLNRAEFELRIENFFKHNNDPKGIFIILDVDNFKQVNDTLGHLAGDIVITRIGEYLTKLFTETNIISRIGGDEFALFIPYNTPYSQL